MTQHKNLIIAAIVISGVAATTSSIAYLNSVKQPAKAVDRADVQKVIQQLVVKPKSASSALVANLSAPSKTIKAAGAVDLNKNYDKADKTILKFSYTNSTGKDLVGSQLVLRVLGKGNFAIGSMKEAKLNKEATKKAGKGAVVFDLPPIKADQTQSLEIPFLARQAGALKTIAELKTADGKIITTVPVTVNAN